MLFRFVQGFFQKQIEHFFVEHQAISKPIATKFENPVSRDYTGPSWKLFHIVKLLKLLPSNQRNFLNDLVHILRS